MMLTETKTETQRFDRGQPGEPDRFLLSNLRDLIAADLELAARRTRDGAMSAVLVQMLQRVIRMIDSLSDVAMASKEIKES